MRLYHRYVLRKAALVLIMGTVICSLSLAVISLVRLGKDRTLGIPPLLVVKLLAHYNLFLSIYSIPISMLIASLLVFGRLSADNELMALRASGVAPVRVFSSTLGLGLALSVLMLGLNGWAAPYSHAALADLTFDAFSLEAFFAPGRTIPLKNYSLHVGAIRNGVLLEVTITERSPDGRTTTIVAESGEFTDRRSLDGKVQLDLFDVQFFIEDEPRAADAGTAAEPDSPEADAAGAAPGGTAEPAAQLVIETAKLYQIVFDFEDIKSRAGRLADKDDLTVRELLARRAAVRRQGDAALAGVYAVEFNKRLVFSLTPLVFAFVGVPLGARVHRGERSLGSAIAAVIALAYYLAILGIEKGSTVRSAVPSELVWAPCVVFLVLGVVLMARVNRGR
jgi:lipopolysaccharide export LptBFGC system permease protein LptF